ncbi:MAG: phosphocholine cytidylyltransferase family protein [Pseudomonadota bacterium]
MRAIVIGAGRGSRLGSNTDHIPKTLVPVMGRPMLDWILDALASAGIARKDVVFVCGYAEQVVRERYPELTFVRNADWANNNILLSLLCARDHFGEGFISTYADIVYDGEIVRKLVAATGDITLGCDTAWRRRYVGRTQHPETDAEKLRAEGARVVKISRTIESASADGEFIGVMKLSAGGARVFTDAFDRAERSYGAGLFREGRTFQKAYLLDLLQEMLEAGALMRRENTAGGYMEIDTGQDLAMAGDWWAEWQRTSGV